MKKLLTIACLLIWGINTAQVRFVDEEYGTISIGVDPNATIKEHSPNVNFNLGLVSYWKYVGANIQVLPGIKGGYIDFTGNFGVNVTTDRFNKMRLYSGLRLGFIKRGYTESKVYTYPLVGCELGANYTICNNTFIGVRSSLDYRSDFKYSGADPSTRFNNSIILGIRF